MLDPKLIRSDLETVAETLSRRGFSLDVDRLTALENRRKELQVSTQDLQRLRNNSAKTIGKAKANGEDTGPLLAAVAERGGTSAGIRAIMCKARLKTPTARPATTPRITSPVWSSSSMQTQYTIMIVF